MFDIFKKITKGKKLHMTMAFLVLLFFMLVALPVRASNNQLGAVASWSNQLAEFNAAAKIKSQKFVESLDNKFHNSKTALRIMGWQISRGVGDVFVSVRGQVARVIDSSFNNTTVNAPGRVAGESEAVAPSNTPLSATNLVLEMARELKMAAVKTTKTKAVVKPVVKKTTPVAKSAVKPNQIVNNYYNYYSDNYYNSALRKDNILRASNFLKNNNFLTGKEGIAIDGDSVLGGTLSFKEGTIIDFSGTHIFNGPFSQPTFINTGLGGGGGGNSSGAGTGVTDHGALTGLGDNDHPQYPLKAGDETISGNWNFSNTTTLATTVIPYLYVDKINFNGSERSGWPIGGGSLGSTTDLPEGTNLYFTNNRARQAIGVSGTSLSYNSSTGVLGVAANYNIPLIVSTTAWNNSSAIVSASSSRWDTAYSWGNHASAGYLTTASAASTYLTQASAASTYLTQASAASTYLTTASAASTYLTTVSAGSTYLTQANAASTYLAKSQNLADLANSSTARTNLGLGTMATQNANNVSITGGSVTSSTISGLIVANFASNNISQWNNNAGYLTAYTETDPVWSAASANYLTTASAASTYLTSATAASNYLTLSAWSVTTTDALQEGSSHKYWSNSLFDARLAAATSLLSVVNIGSSSVTTTMLGNVKVNGDMDVAGGATFGTINATLLNVDSITLGGSNRSTWPSGSSGGSGGGSFWATSSDDLVGYPDLSGNYAIVVGAAATSSDNIRFEVVGNVKIKNGSLTLNNGNATIGGSVTTTGSLDVGSSFGLNGEYFTDLTGAGLINDGGVLTVATSSLGLPTYSDLSNYLTTASAASTYLTQANAASTYLTTANAASTYLTTASAASTYLTTASAGSTYLTQANASSTYLKISAASTTLWDTAYSWGNHASAGYLTTASAASTYLTQATAASTYLTTASAASTYLTTANAASTYQPIGSYLTAYTETDPIWIAASSSYLKISDASSTYVAKSQNLADLANSSTARTNLGLGTMATQNANNVSITGGSVASSTVSGLIVANFASNNISQWNNNAGYLTAYTETDPLAIHLGTTSVASITTLANLSITKSQVSDFGGPYLTAYTETDPVWSAASANYLTTASAASTYLTQANAASTYLTTANAASTYLTTASAASTYLTTASAGSTYLTQANASSTYLKISAASTTLWDTAYSWGNHASAGYLTTASAASTYLTQATAASTYLTTASAASTYLTTANAASTYLTLSAWSATTTDALQEGSNHKYYTDARVASYINGSTTLPAFLNYWAKTGNDINYSAGKVGVNNPNPQTALDVAGTVSSTALNVTGNATVNNNLNVLGTALTASNLTSMSLADSASAPTITIGNNTASMSLIASNWSINSSGVASFATITSAVWSGGVIDLPHGGTGSTTAAGARTNLGLGTMATQNANNVSITGGSVTSSTISGLIVANFASNNISQWNNNAGYLTAYTETDPVWSAASANYLTTASAASTYLTQANAASTYLTTANAASTYLTTASAASTYLTTASAGSTYLTQASASSTYQPIGSYLTAYTETDPLAIHLGTTSVASITTLANLSITKSQVSDFGGPYLTAYTETDPVWSAASANYLTTASAASTYLTQAGASSTYLKISAASTTLWDTAYSWGNHASAGYLTTTSAASTYLTQATAASTYLTQAAASSAYLTIANAASTYQPIGSYLTAYTETDPVWSAASANYLTTASAASTYLTQAGASSSYLTLASASATYLSLSGGTVSGDVNVSGTSSLAVVSSSYICLNGDCISSWPTGGSSSSSVNYWFDDGVNLSPVTSTRGLAVNGGAHIFGSLDVQNPIGFYITAAPLTIVSTTTSTDYSMDFDMGMPNTAYVINDKNNPEGGIVQIRQNQMAYISSADGLNDWGVVCINVENGYRLLTMYFKNSDFVGATNTNPGTNDNAYFDTWLSTLAGGASIAVDYYAQSIWTGNGSTANYTWANPDGKSVVSGFVNPPTFNHVSPNNSPVLSVTPAYNSPGEVNVNGKLLVLNNPLGIGTWNGSNHYSYFMASSSQSTDIYYTLPASIPNADAVLMTNAFGQLSWSTSTGGSSEWLDTGYGSLSPVDSSKGLVINGTTTLAYGSYFGNGSSSLQITQVVPGAVDIPMLVGTNTNYGGADAVAVKDNLIVYSDSQTPTLSLFGAGGPASSTDLVYNPLTDVLNFTNAVGGYNFDSRVSIGTSTNRASLSLNGLNAWSIGAAYSTNTLDRLTSAVSSGVTYNDKWYIFGGTAFLGNSSNLKVYDLGTNQWSDGVGDTGNNRFFHSAVVYNNKMYVFGGQDDHDNVLSSMRVYDFNAQTWSDGTADIGYERSGHSAVVYNNKMYVFGGQDINSNTTSSLRIYDFNTDSWSSGTSDDTYSSPFHAAAVYGNKMYIVGFDNNSLSATTRVYNFDTDSWSNGVPDVGYVHAMATASVIGDKMYIYGGGLVGDNSFKYLNNNLRIYNFSSDTWESGQRGVGPLMAAVSTAYNNNLYVYGGFSEDFIPRLQNGDMSALESAINNMVYIYDPAKDLDLFDIYSNNQKELSFQAGGNLILNNNYLNIHNGSLKVSDGGSYFGSLSGVSGFSVEATSTPSGSLDQKTFAFTVYAVDKNGLLSAPSPTRSCTISSTDVATCALSWAGVAAADYYRIYARIDNYTMFFNATSTSYNLTTTTLALDGGNLFPGFADNLLPGLGTAAYFNGSVSIGDYYSPSNFALTVMGNGSNNIAQMLTQTGYGMTIMSNGYVGIHDANPSSSLSVVGDGTYHNIAQFFNQSGYGVTINTNGNLGINNSYSSAMLAVNGNGGSTNLAELLGQTGYGLVVRSDGRVGIGGGYSLSQFEVLGRNNSEPIASFSNEQGDALNIESLSFNMGGTSPSHIAILRGQGYINTPGPTGYLPYFGIYDGLNLVSSNDFGQWPLQLSFNSQNMATSSDIVFDVFNQSLSFEKASSYEFYGGVKSDGGAPVLNIDAASQRISIATSTSWNNYQLTVAGSAAVTNNLDVLGTSTLSTTTMAFGSKIGSSTGAYFTVDNTYIGTIPAGGLDPIFGTTNYPAVDTPNYIPMVKFSSPDFVINGIAGGIDGSLVVIENTSPEYGGDPSIAFAAADFISGMTFNVANINYKTSSKQLMFKGASSYYFDSLDPNNGGLNGAVYSNNGVLTNTDPSSREYKDNIAPTNLNIDALLGLQIKSFKWKKGGQPDFGLIAEEIRDALPELYQDNGQTKGYRNDHLPFYLLQIAQRQEAELKVLENKVNSSGTSGGIIAASGDQALPVDEASTFYGTITVIGEAGFESKVTFKDHVYFDRDAAGTAKVLMGATSTQVIFNKPYESVPIINVTPLANIVGRNYWIENQTTTGFMIAINPALDKDVEFNWQAIAVDPEVVANSDTVVDSSTTDIQDLVFDGDSASSSVNNPSNFVASDTVATTTNPIMPNYNVSSTDGWATSSQP